MKNIKTLLFVITVILIVGVMGIKAAVSIKSSQVTYKGNKTVESSLDELFKELTYGKEQLAASITNKGVETTSDNTLVEMANNIDKINKVELLNNGMVINFSEANFTKNRMIEFRGATQEAYVYVGAGYHGDVSKMVPTSTDENFNYEELATVTIAGGTGTPTIKIYKVSANSLTNITIPTGASDGLGDIGIVISEIIKTKDYEVIAAESNFMANLTKTFNEGTKYAYIFVGAGYHGVVSKMVPTSTDENFKVEKLTSIQMSGGTNAATHEVYRVSADNLTNVTIPTGTSDGLGSSCIIIA